VAVLAEGDEVIGGVGAARCAGDDVIERVPRPATVLAPATVALVDFPPENRSNWLRAADANMRRPVLSTEHARRYLAVRGAHSYFPTPRGLGGGSAAQASVFQS